MEQRKITNITQLTDNLLENFEKLQKGAIHEKRAKEISNMAGKIINSTKVQLEYNNYMKYRSKIAFLENEKPQSNG